MFAKPEQLKQTISRFIVGLADTKYKNPIADIKYRLS